MVLGFFSMQEEEEEGERGKRRRKRKRKLSKGIRPLPTSPNLAFMTRVSPFFSCTPLYSVGLFGWGDGRAGSF